MAGTKVTPLTIDEVILRVDLALAESHKCSHEELVDETNGYSCSDPATVYDLVDEQYLCARHGRHCARLAVSR